MTNADNVPRKVTIADLLNAGATVDLITAAGALGIGRTKAYELARAGEFPCHSIRLGDTYRISTPALLELICGVPVLPPIGAGGPGRLEDQR